MLVQAYYLRLIKRYFCPGKYKKAPVDEMMRNNFLTHDNKY